MKFNKLIPELTVSNIQNSKRFYTDILGFKIEYERAEDGFAFVSLGEAQIMLDSNKSKWDTGEKMYPFGRGINFQIDVEDINSIVESIKEYGIVPFKDIFTSKYKCDNIVYLEKQVLILDPDGYLLRFSETIAE